MAGGPHRFPLQPSPGFTERSVPDFRSKGLAILWYLLCKRPEVIFLDVAMGAMSLNGCGIYVYLHISYLDICIIYIYIPYIFF